MFVWALVSVESTCCAAPKKSASKMILALSELRADDAAAQKKTRHGGSCEGP
jgi:hypothetical protein